MHAYEDMRLTRTDAIALYHAIEAARESALLSTRARRHANMLADELAAIIVRLDAKRRGGRPKAA